MNNNSNNKSWGYVEKLLQVACGVSIFVIFGWENYRKKIGKVAEKYYFPHSRVQGWGKPEVTHHFIPTFFTSSPQDVHNLSTLGKAVI